MLKKILPFILAILAMPLFMLAQTTTSSVSGLVKNKNGEALPGASITVVHVPTGTIYTTSARAGGRFEINNMNPGGPYTVSGTFVGYSKDVKENIYLDLGETQKIDFDLGTQANQLAEVTVASTRTGQKNGVETTVGRERMQNMPTVGRTIPDYLRAVPQMKLSGGGNVSSEGAMSFGGQNVRYNSFYIDGAVNNDVFGLAYSGTNGGQSGIAPISIDAIDQFQVSLSPYNASLGNFTGAAINAITKSGTNEVHGSAYYIFRNENLSGKTPTGPKDSATKLNPFSNKTYGATLGGPVIKNKLFFFLSAELQRDNTPQPFDLATYRGDTKDLATIQRLKDTVAARGGGYNIGGFTNNETVTESDRITGKLDWNISQRNKLSLSYRYNSGLRSIVFASSPTSIAFDKNGYVFPSKTNSASAELKSKVGRNSSNRFLATFTNVEDNRGPIGGGTAFPVVQITDGTQGRFNFGTESNSTFNYLKQETYNVVNQFKFTLGKNAIMVGAEAEYFKAYNTFIPSTAGNYQYASLQDFFDNAKPTQYTANFPLIGGKDEKNTDAAAKFNVFKGALFLNDEIRVSKSLSLNFGVRADYYKFLTTARADSFAIDSALPKFAQYYNLKGARPGLTPKIPVEFSPRFGFNLNLADENVTIRGGVGLFAGRIPMVWPGGIYNNNGLSSGGYTLSAFSNTAIWNQNLVRFRTTPYTPQEVGISLSNAKGQLNLISKEFRMPKVLKTSIAFDKRLEKGWSLSLENQFTKNINDIYYQNVNLLPPTLRMATGPDSRNVYPNPVNIPIRSNGVNPYNNGVYLIRNVDGRKGFAYNLTLGINKAGKTFNFSGNYNYGLSRVINEAQSSTSNSQWSSMETVNGRNNLMLSESDNSAAHRIFGYVSKKFNYVNKHVSTTISLAYNGQSGQPFSYVYNGQAVRDGINFNDLIYIPTVAELQAMTFITTSTVTATPQAQKDALNAFIDNDKYLSKHRGQYAERNSNRTPFTHVVDLKIAQAFNVKLGNKTYSAEVGYSMFNFTNFINRDWGRQYIVANDNYSLMNFSYTSATNLTPRYTFNPATKTAPTVYQRFNPQYTARWLSQLEFRIKF